MRVPKVAVVFRTLLLMLLVINCIYWLGMTTLIDIKYSQTLPEARDEESSRIHEISVNHGAIRYASTAELNRYRFYSTFYVPAIGVSMVVMAFLVAFYDDFGFWRELRRPGPRMI